MNPQQLQSVKSSWRTLRLVNPVLLGDVFYSKLFFDHPGLKSLFHISKEEQSKKLIDMLNVIVGRIDRFDELKDDIAALAIRHVHYGVKPPHYKAVGDALLWTFQQGLGNEYTTDVAEAWALCFDELAEMMISSAASGMVQQ